MTRLNIEKAVLVILAVVFGILASIGVGILFFTIINNTDMWSMAFVIYAGVLGACIQATLLTIAVFIIVKIKDLNEHKRW